MSASRSAAAGLSHTPPIPDQTEFAGNEIVPTRCFHSPCLSADLSAGNDDLPLLPGRPYKFAQPEGPNFQRADRALPVIASPAPIAPPFLTAPGRAPAGCPRAAGRTVDAAGRTRNRRASLRPRNRPSPPTVTATDQARDSDGDRKEFFQCPVDRGDITGNGLKPAFQFHHRQHFLVDVDSGHGGPVGDQFFLKC